ncbi:unnamed protein product [Ceutorhynchus assimilis]|uniref:Uncharacterized protein n=1 Tax=Ceutorhynchus assimilis TaxID=467358 RepID=A0A9N9MHA1_9CUCU|nr:unnamed protein product [Ceutorhynchus assimilis]
MLMKILFCVVSLVAVIDGREIKCYFCIDDNTLASKHDHVGNCKGIAWSVISDCKYGCVTYQAKIKEFFDAGVDNHFARWRRGCAVEGGCAKIEANLHERWKDDILEYDCQECDKDYCNNRANHPGYNFKGRLGLHYTWERESK